MSYPGEMICGIVGHEQRRHLAAGHEQIRQAYAELLAGRPSFASAGQQPVIRNADLALTSTRLPGGGATVEIARRQPDGSWRWVIDQPAVLS